MHSAVTPCDRLQSQRCNELSRKAVFNEASSWAVSGEKLLLEYLWGSLLQVFPEKRKRWWVEKKWEEEKNTELEIESKLAEKLVKTALMAKVLLAMFLSDPTDCQEDIKTLS